MVRFQGTHDQKVSLSEKEQITCGQRFETEFLPDENRTETYLQHNLVK